MRAHSLLKSGISEPFALILELIVKRYFETNCFMGQETNCSTFNYAHSQQKNQSAIEEEVMDRKFHYTFQLISNYTLFSAGSSETVKRTQSLLCNKE